MECFGQACQRVCGDCHQDISYGNVEEPDRQQKVDAEGKQPHRCDVCADPGPRSKDGQTDQHFDDADEAQKSALAGSVRGQLNVSLRRNTRLIDIVAEDATPDGAQKLANAVVEAFLDAHESDRQGETGRAHKFLTRQAEKLKEKLEKSEGAVLASVSKKKQIACQRSRCRKPLRAGRAEFDGKQARTGTRAELRRQVQPAGRSERRRKALCLPTGLLADGSSATCGQAWSPSIARLS